MNEQQMFEKSFQRPCNFFKLSKSEQWQIDANLGILDWEGDSMSEDDKKKFVAHYQQ